MVFINARKQTHIYTINGRNTLLESGMIHLVPNLINNLNIALYLTESIAKELTILSADGYMEGYADFDIEIIKEMRSYKTYYHCVSRDFELAELRLIIDAIASSKFITLKKSKDLIEKLEKMASHYDAKLVKREVYISGRVKSMNESVLYTVDAIQNAIAYNHKITFQYFNWNVDGEMELRHKSQERLEYMQQRDENVRQYYRQLTSKFRDTADLRREYEEKLNQVYEKLGFEREAEKQELSANQVAATAEREEQNHLGVREIADKIIETKTAEMEAKDISYDVEMEFPDDLDMELIDLSSLLNNLFDNAMEAVEFCHAELKDTGEMRSEYPQIKGVTYQEGDAFVIDVENVKSSRQKVVEVNKHYRTSKQDSTGHGYGLQIVERIAKKYRGEMKVSYKKDSFRNKVLIRAI